MAKDNKKIRLEESFIRRSMKLANIENLSEQFVQEKMKKKCDEGEELEEAEEASLEDEELPGEEMPEEEPSMEEPVAEPDVEDLVQAIVDAISDKTGVEIEVEGGAEEEMPSEEPEEELPSEEEPGEEMALEEQEQEGQVKATPHPKVDGMQAPGKTDFSDDKDFKLSDAPKPGKNMAESLENLERVVLEKVLKRLQESMKASPKKNKK